MCLDEEVLDKYLKAGEIVHKTLEKAIDAVKPGLKIEALCDNLEAYIVSQGARPAFPVNVSINEVAAHYTSPIGDPSRIPENGLVKIDVGAHVDGYIVDAAVTVPLTSKYQLFVDASMAALRDIATRLKPGVNLGRLGGVIERAIRSYGLSPVRNLTGHLISRYRLHAGKSVPNVSTITLSKTLPGEIYAIEPFATDGRGFVIEDLNSYIYRLKTVKRVKETSLRRLLKVIKNRFDRLPFAERWLKNYMSVTSLRENMRKMLSLKIIQEYPVLVEQSGGYVSQMEDTFVVTRRGAFPLARTLSIIK